MIARLIALFATSEASVLKRRLKIAIFAYLALGIAALFAVVFLVLAAYLAAAIRWGALEAAVWFGVAFVVLTGIVFIAYKIVSGAERRAQQRKRAADTSLLAGASAMALLPSLISRKGGLATLLAMAAGIGAYSLYREFERGKEGNPDED